jgi:glycosyltransferase involved in cell wall biosynthesis
VTKPVMPQHVLIISHDVVGPEMSGPGIRYSQLTRVLADHFDVTLAAPGGATAAAPVEGKARGSSYQQIGYERLSDPSLVGAIERATVVVAPALTVAELRPLLGPQVALVVDVYDPYVAETLAAQGSVPAGTLINLTAAALRGDLFICANRRQRFWWLGWLEALGRLNEWTYRDDPLLGRLVALVPFGLSEAVAQPSKPVVKGVWPEVAASDRVVLWGGGIWPWLDANTAIRAMSLVSRERRDLRLVFPGTRHPNPAMSGGNVFAEQAKQLADDLELTGRAVVFGDWTPYQDWPNLLLESDIGLTLHHPILEAELAHRSRALDYMWAEIPIVATEGDAISELVAEHGLGRVVGYRDENGVAEAILALAERPREEWRANFTSVKQQLTWRKAAEPLIAFCQSPNRSADAFRPVNSTGNPYYEDRLSHAQRQFEQAQQAVTNLSAELDITLSNLAEREQQLHAAQNLVSRYESGRFIRFMKWSYDLRKRLNLGRTQALR